MEGANLIRSESTDDCVKDSAIVEEDEIVLAPRRAHQHRADMHDRDTYQS